MATNLISYPFRVAPNGSVVTRPDDSSTYYAELLAMMVLTHPGERVQVPLYGQSDPTFTALDAQELIYKVGLFGPPVTITMVKSRFRTAVDEDITIQFTPLARDAADLLSLRG